MDVADYAVFMCDALNIDSAKVFTGYSLKFIKMSFDFRYKADATDSPNMTL